MKKVTSYLIAGKIFSNTAEAQNLNSSKRLGEKSNGKIYYSLSEALYLLEKKELQILNHQDKTLTKQEVYKKFQNLDKNFKAKYIVYKDLKDSGYIPKTALKFGSDFRIYKNKSEKHSSWLVHVATEGENFKWQEFQAKNRVANSAKKKLLIAVVDEENSVTYSQVSYIKP